jgi:hypothetical protein
MANYGRRNFVGGIARPQKFRGIDQNSVFANNERNVRHAGVSLIWEPRLWRYS